MEKSQDKHYACNFTEENGKKFILKVVMEGNLKTHRLESFVDIKEFNMKLSALLLPIRITLLSPRIVLFRR